MIRRDGNIFSLFVGSWTYSAMRSYMTALCKAASWRITLALALVLCVAAMRGAMLLLLVPLMHIVGLDTEQGPVSRIDDLVSSGFAALSLRPTLIAVLTVYLALSVAQALVTRWQSVFNLRLEQEFVAYLRQGLYRAIANTSWLSFTRRRSSDLTHALTIELDRVGDATRSLLATIANAIILSVYVLLALRLSLEMTALVFGCGAGLLLLLRKKTQAARWTGEEISLATNGLYAAAMEHLGGMKVIKSYGVEERSADDFSELAGQVAQMRLNATRTYADAGFWFQVSSVSALCAILYVAFKVLALPAAGLLLLLFLFTRIIPLFAGVQQSYQQYLNDLPAFAKVMDLRVRCEEAAEPKGEPRPKARRLGLQGNIRFENVSFSYDEEGEAATIRDLDLAIEAGKVTALVGPSGSGKSTIADLVMGLILPAEGRVLVDGEPLRPEGVRAWRDRIGYVAQDSFLFNDTVRANLLWACPEASEEEISRALELAAAKTFVSQLPDGLETVLGDRGIRISGGERQRLSLARALLREPSLLVLDEATNALDPENEQHIWSAIENLNGRTTVLIITHRLSALRGADVILVLEAGRLVESGKWEELVGSANGRFDALRVPAKKTGT